MRAVPPERRYARGKGGARSRDHAGERGQGAGARGQGALGRRPPANRGLPAVPHAEKRGALGYRYLLAEAMPDFFEEHENGANEKFRSPTSARRARLYFSLVVEYC